METDGPLDRKSPTSRDFSRRRPRFRRQANDYSARGDYQYPDELMTSSTTLQAPPGGRHGNNRSDVSSERKMSLPTDPEVDKSNDDDDDDDDANRYMSLSHTSHVTLVVSETLNL